MRRDQLQIGDRVVVTSAGNKRWNGSRGIIEAFPYEDEPEHLVVTTTLPESNQVCHLHTRCQTLDLERDQYGHPVSRS